MMLHARRLLLLLLLLQELSVVRLRSAKITVDLKSRFVKRRIDAFLRHSDAHVESRVVLDVLVAALLLEREGAMKRRVRRIPSVRKRNFHVVGAFMRRPIEAERLDANAEVVTAVLHEERGRLLKEAAIVATLRLAGVRDGLVDVGEEIHSDGHRVCRVGVILERLGKGRESEAFRGRARLRRFAR